MTAAKESLLAKLCTRTTCHGPLDFYQSKGFGRLFWGLITLGAFAAVGYYGYRTTAQYLQNPRATSIDEISTDQLLFPNITICNPARYNATWIEEQVLIPPQYLPYLATIPISEHDFKREFVRYLRMLSFSMEAYNYNDPPVRTLLGALGMLYDNMFNKSVNPNAQNITDFISSATFDCPKHLIGCKFAQQPFDCCQFARKAFTDNGYCYTIDMRRSTTADMFQTAPGEDFGLEVTVETNMDNVLIQDAVEEVGVRVHIVDYATPMDFNPVAVFPDVHAHIRLQPVHYILSQDVDKCLIRGRPLDPYETYTKTLCEMRCYDQMVMAAAQCEVMASFVKRNTEDVCPPITMFSEVFPRMIGLTNDSMSYRESLLNCFSSQCPKMCDYWSYATYVMYSKISGNGNSTAASSASAGGNTVTMKLSVYFPDLVYEEYQEHLLTNWNTFVSNLGGVVGLWTGISVLSIVQCLAILIFGPCEDNYASHCVCSKRK